MAENVDAMLVINNERLFDIYSGLSVVNAFAKADDTLSIAAKSIAEIITMHGIINLDFNDVKTVLKDGGVALMSTGYGEGEGRVKKAIEDALNSPLLNDNDVYHSKKLLLSVWFGEAKDGRSELMMEEMDAINKFMEGFSDDIETKWGLSKDPELGEKIKVTILATGFGMKSVTDRTPIAKAPEQGGNRQDQDEDGRIEGYYGGTNGSKKHFNPHIYLFSDSDLDNDNLISTVESMPTYKRTTQQVNDIRNTSKDNAAKDTVSKPQTNVSGTIKFG